MIAKHAKIITLEQHKNNTHHDLTTTNADNNTDKGTANNNGNNCNLTTATANCNPNTQPPINQPTITTIIIATATTTTTTATTTTNTTTTTNHAAPVSSSLLQKSLFFLVLSAPPPGQPQRRKPQTRDRVWIWKCGAAHHSTMRAWLRALLCFSVLAAAAALPKADEIPAENGMALPPLTVDGTDNLADAPKEAAAEEMADKTAEVGNGRQNS